MSITEFRLLKAAGEISASIFCNVVPGFLSVHAPAPEFHHVGWHKRRRVCVLRRGGENFQNALRLDSGAARNKFSCAPSCDSRQLKLALFKPIRPDASKILSHGICGMGLGASGFGCWRRDLCEHVEKSFRVEPAVIQRRVVELRKFVGGENRVVGRTAASRRRSGARRPVRRL